MAIKSETSDYERQNTTAQAQKSSLEGQAKWSAFIQQLALWSGIVMAAVAVITLLIGFWNSNRNEKAQVRIAEAQVQLLALNTIQHYLDLAVEHPDLASRKNNQPVDAKYTWFAADALLTAQTLQALVGQQANWQGSINSIIRQHQSYLRSDAFVCDDFAPEFVNYLRERVADLRCAESKAAE